MRRRFGWVVVFSWGEGGGEEDSPGQVLQSRFRRRQSGSNIPIFYVIYYPHTSDSEGSDTPRSVTDSTEQWVWCIMYMSLCYMLFLLYV